MTDVPRLEPLADGTGFRTRVRFGKGQQRRFRIPIIDPALAAARAVALHAMARDLARSPIDPERAERMLEEAARAGAGELKALLAVAVELGGGETKQKPSKPLPASETVTQYAERWFDDRARRGLSSVDTDRGRLDNHVLPVLGQRPMVAVTPDDLRAVVEHLDGKARAGTFAWSTALKVWGLVTKMFSDACRSKAAALRVRSDNPAKDVEGPDVGDDKAKQWLYPSEAALLLACADVPLRWRRLYALAIYLYVRPGELAVLDWKDVNAEQAYVYIHRALDLRTGVVKSTKTGITRKVPIHPSLAPLLEALRAECGGSGRVLQHTHEKRGEASSEHGMPPLEDLAATFREHLWRAGVRRADLHEERPTTKRITYYDCRATGITWEVLAGTDHIRIMQRAGHAQFSTTQGYIREAEALDLNAGTPFGPLPDSLVGSAPRAKGEPVKRKSVETGSELLRPQRDLNKIQVVRM